MSRETSKSQMTPPSKSPPEKVGSTGVLRINVEALLQGARDMILVHGTQDYRLRVTSNGKLILTK